jgi:hypothetical protein
LQAAAQHDVAADLHLHIRVALDRREVRRKRLLIVARTCGVVELQFAADIPTDHGFEPDRSDLHIGDKDDHSLTRGESAAGRSLELCIELAPPTVTPLKSCLHGRVGGTLGIALKSRSRRSGYRLIERYRSSN